MAIRPVQEAVPDTLNPARLFLDDIEEIIRIFVEAERDRNGRLPGNPDEALKPSFRVGNQTCDELADLARIYPPFTNTFLVQVQRTGFDAFVHIDTGSTRWFAYGLNDNEEWGLFHKLEPIFEKRRLAWKSALHSHPRASYMVYGAASALLLFLVPTLFLIPFINRVPRIASLLTNLTEFSVLGTVTLVVLFLALRLGLRSHSVVIFRNHSDYSTQRRALIWKTIPEFVKIVAGFLLGLLTLYFKHKFWP
jgi:hypothetical protein